MVERRKKEENQCLNVGEMEKTSADPFVNRRWLAELLACLTLSYRLPQPVLSPLVSLVRFVDAMACQIPLAVIFFDLFKVVRRSVSLLVVFFMLMGTAIEMLPC